MGSKALFRDGFSSPGRLASELGASDFTTEGFAKPDRFRRLVGNGFRVLVPPRRRNAWKLRRRDVGTSFFGVNASKHTTETNRPYQAAPQTIQKPGFPEQKHVFLMLKPLFSSWFGGPLVYNGSIGLPSQHA